MPNFVYLYGETLDSLLNFNIGQNQFQKGALPGVKRLLAFANTLTLLSSQKLQSRWWWADKLIGNAKGLENQQV